VMVHLTPLITSASVPLRPVPVVTRVGIGREAVLILPVFTDAVPDLRQG
jgi:hypothetical protein